ncbi:MAG: hypothetical protein GF329_09730 [Candidatus Lokiarchaeota archaeon]|nr:hypothetical protein [Candidatus Lokiarchaeota archaeon]
MRLVASLSCAGSNCGCPSIYETDEGTYIIQGKKVNARKIKQVNIPPDEELVEIPAELLNKI